MIYICLNNECWDTAYNVTLAPSTANKHLSLTMASMCFGLNPAILRDVSGTGIQ